MSRFRTLTGLTSVVLAVALGAPASGRLTSAAQVTAETMGPLGIGCVDGAASFSGHAYCLDGNHPGTLAAVAAAPSENDIIRQQGIEQLDGWQVPTRCDGNGKSGKRVQLVYVHVAGSPSIAKTALPFILQRLVPGANGVFEHSSKGKRAIRWVTTRKAGACVPSVITATVPKAALVKGFPFDNIARGLRSRTRSSVGPTARTSSSSTRRTTRSGCPSATVGSAT